MGQLAVHTSMRDGELLWSPTEAQRQRTNLAAYQRWLATHRDLHFADYGSLWEWSVTEIEAFWQSLWDYFDVFASVPPRTVLTNRRMPGAEWFPGCRLNFAQHVLRNEDETATALLYVSETEGIRGLGWPELAGQVRRLATRLRAHGIRPGDRVVAYLPNVPEAVIAMLATTAIGAVWVSCAPEFGARGVLDRVTQLGPKVLLCIDGYRYGGKDYDRRAEVRDIVAGFA